MGLSIVSISQEIKELFKKPRLLIQYLILNFFLISVGVAAVVYSKKEILLEHTRVQSEQILNVGQALEGVDLPPKVEQKVDQLEQRAEQSLKGDETEDPKAQSSSAK